MWNFILAPAHQEAVEHFIFLKRVELVRAASTLTNIAF
jgi:hypothetical protein